MSDTELVEMPLLAELEALRAEGAQRLDAVRFHYLDTLCRRMQEQQGAVRNVLHAKLHAALKAYGEQFRHTHKVLGSPVENAAVTRLGGIHDASLQVSKAVRKSGLLSLVNLNHHIKNKPPENMDSGLIEGGADSSEMMSVRHFKQGWARICAQEQVQQAASQGPKNAGPLNSHMLVLRSVKLMRNLSPIYLEQFLSHIDSLLWLDNVNLKPVAPKAKPKRQAQQRKQIPQVGQATAP